MTYLFVFYLHKAPKPNISSKYSELISREHKHTHTYNIKFRYIEIGFPSNKTGKFKEAKVVFVQATETNLLTD